MSITAKELAKELGLSEAAVSLALNNKQGVSTQTRQRVWEKAKEMGFDFTKSSIRRIDLKGTIALVMYKKSGAVVADTPFFSALTEGVLAGCKRNGYDFVIKYIYEDDSLSEQLYLLKNAELSGIILLATEMTLASLQPFTKFKTPVVLLDAYFDSAPFDSVLINNAQGAFLATDYLITKRKRQPGYLHSSYPISKLLCPRRWFLPCSATSWYVLITLYRASSDTLARGDICRYEGAHSIWNTNCRMLLC